MNNICASMSSVHVTDQVAVPPQQEDDRRHVDRFACRRQQVCSLKR